MDEKRRPAPDVNAETKYAKVTFTVKELGPDENRHAQPYILIEFDQELIPEVDGTHGSISLQFRNYPTDIREAQRVAKQLRETFVAMSLLSFDPGDLRAQQHWFDTEGNK